MAYWELLVRLSAAYFFGYNINMILVLGGAGYIGSHVNKLLHERGYETVVFDNLITGHENAVKWGKFYRGSLENIEDIRRIFEKYAVEAVMDFAAFIEAGESMIDPEKFFYNNTVNTLNLLKVMREFKIEKFIFSSTAAVYGNPQYTPMDEKHPQWPINYYGWSKFFNERIMESYSGAYGLKYVALRYFNACGADEAAEIGEYHQPESHLIPLILDAALGKKESIKIFGTDYETDDGTPIRDYIHVSDLAEAHLLALKYLLEGGESNQYNLGNGRGFSVREVLESVKRVTKKEFKVEEAGRRPGDPAILVAGSEKIKKELGWNPKYGDIDKIIESAWRWHQKKEKI